MAKWMMDLREGSQSNLKNIMKKEKHDVLTPSKISSPAPMSLLIPHYLLYEHLQDISMVNLQMAAKSSASLASNQ